MSDTLTEMATYYRSLNDSDIVRLTQAQEAFDKELKILLQETIHSIMLLLLREPELTLDEIIGQMLLNRGYGGAVSNRSEASKKLKEQQAIQQMVYVAINAMTYIKDVEMKKGRKYTLTSLGHEKAKGVTA